MRLAIDIYEYWHAGSGAGRGPTVDAEVVKTQAGLPYLPGKTLKGLLREGVAMAVDCGALDQGAVGSLFGTWSGGDASQPGLLRVTNAELPPEYEAWVAGSPGSKALASTLLREIASTAMENGVAKAMSLRTREVAVPMTLYAYVHGPGDGAWQKQLETALPFVRGLGVGRRRGLGRCRIRSVEEGQS